MKKAILVTLKDPEIVELMRIRLDEDAGAALTFLRTHLKGKARGLLESD